jgi:UDP-N-acetylglucosamine 2-epimerase (non-hydrolysing)
MKIAFIFGTRPEIIKVAPIIRECIKRNIDFITIHSGQHYTYELDKIFFEELELPMPNYNLNIKSKVPFRQGEHTGRILIEVENIILEEKPDILLVHGDTNTALSGALISRKISTTKHSTGRFVYVGHIEAGLRSYDPLMTEEINRVICDHLSNFLFCPTSTAMNNALKEGINKEKIFLTGNTVVDSVYQNLGIAKQRTDVLKKIELREKEYILVTVHRQENVDVKEKLTDIMKGLGLVYNHFGLPVVYPMHPRTKKIIEKFGISIPDGINVIPPLGFLEFLQLEFNAKIILTDSGGVQEESCILNVPCVTLRDNTERPETIGIGSNIVAGTDPENMLSACKKMMSNERKNWTVPFGDGKASEKILDILLTQLQKVNK